ncbi:MAG: 16S rRNA processing protein RimM [Bacteroidales bacterium]|nr:16S rRNA processing protein RimM [Bacteroidales bacterium]
MQKEDFFLLGKITKFNKKSGDVTILAVTDSPETYINSGVLFLEIDGGLVPFFVRDLKLKGQDGFQVLFEDYDFPEKAQHLVGLSVFLPSEQLTELASDQFYFHEILEFMVIDVKIGELGPINQVLEAPEQNLLQVFYHKKEVLIPLVDDFIVRINKRKKQLFMDLPDGLIDL